MLSKEMLEKLNTHLNEELAAFYKYLSMSAYCRSQSLNGCAHWFKCQADEEMEHAMKFFDFIDHRGERVTLQAIAQPPIEFESLLHCFEMSLASEQHVTKGINNLMDFAIKENDYGTQNFLQWFVTEQLEEEASVTEIIDQVKLVGESGQGLFLLDRQLANRSGDHDHHH